MHLNDLFREKEMECEMYVNVFPVPYLKSMDGLMHVISAC